MNNVTAGEFHSPDEALLHRVQTAVQELGDWLEAAGYAGNDPYQLDNIISSVGHRPIIGPLMGLARRLLKPYHALIPRQIFQASRPIVMAQALGDALAAEGMLPASEQTRRRASRLYEMLLEHRSPLAQNDAWGLPFVWGGVERHEKHWPMAITTVLVINGLLEARHLLDEGAVLKHLESSLRFMIEECGILRTVDGVCILYGPGDTRLILNASAAAAGLMARASSLLDRPDLMLLAEDAARLIAHHQNPDGSWFFAPAHGTHLLDPIIDFRHTGYILEGLAEVREHSGSAELAATLSSAVERGWAYARSALVEGDLPRWAPNQTWPIDAHDVAEAILLAVAMGDQDLARRHVEAALRDFYIGDGQFRYKLFADGRKNDSVFIRWTQAPMYKALTRFAAAGSASDGAGH
ncbi:hypothetical protein [Bosea sp. FBZP-16]|uniref:hypothetical protein n=1 Tax=Bosea sp. FBZP-16 TaxID=2065382 RepID=UPI000C3119A3|nr:hypothetical protein [Bosea sp. FBZP-16]